MTLPVVLGPVVGVVYAINLYIKSIGVQTGLTTTGIIGSILFKLAIGFGLPALKSIIFGLIIGGIIRWLRGGRTSRPPVSPPTSDRPG